MLDITIIASSSAGNCAIVSDGTTSLLLDCGIRFREIQRATGFKVSELGACLLSHEHDDHAHAARSVQRNGVDVWASRGTLDALDLFEHRSKRLKDKSRFEIGTWKGRAFAVPHDAAEPLGFLLQSGNERLLYLSDCAYCPYRFKGLTHIMIECNWSTSLLRGSQAEVQLKRRILSTHMSLERLLQFLAANDLSCVREIHLLHLSDDHSDEAAFKEAVERATGKLTRIAPKVSEVAA